MSTISTPTHQMSAAVEKFFQINTISVYDLCFKILSERKTSMSKQYLRNLC